MLISLACVSAADSEDTNSTAGISDEIELQTNQYDDTSLSNTNEYELGAITPTVTITDSVNTGKTNNIAKGTKVTIDVKATANFNYHYDNKVATLYVGGNSIESINLQPYNYDGNDRRGSFDYTFSNEGTYDVKVVLAAYAGYGESYNEATSNTITYIVGGGTSTEEPSVNINIYDMAYPNNLTISHEGDCVMDIAYNIVKTGGTFSNEMLTLFINGINIGNNTPNNSKRLGNISINEDNTYLVNIVYSAEVNGNTITNTSNTLTYVITKTSGGSGVENPSADLTISDNNAPDNVTIYHTGDYNAEITYNLVKSNHEFTNEVLTVTVSDNKGGKSEFTASSKTFTVALTSGNEYTISVSYSATVEGESITADSNTLTYVIVNQSSTEPISDVTIDFRDKNYPSNTTITLNDKYTPYFEFYATLPTSGTIWYKEVRIICNGVIASLSDFSDKTWTGIQIKELNETNDYEIKAELYIMMLMSEQSEYDVFSKTITYHIKTDNGEEEPTSDPSVNLTISDVSAPNNSTIYHTGDFNADLTYNLDKSSHEFTDEVLNVSVSDNKGGKSEFSITSTTFTVPLISGNEYTITVVYSAKVNNKTFTKTSNTLNYIILNQSGEQPTSDVSIDIRDVNYPSNTTITLNDKYTPYFEFYATLPTSGTIWYKEVRIICNGVLSDFSDKTWTRISANELNETNDYIIKAELVVTTFMGETPQYDVFSKTIAYHISVPANGSENKVSANLTISDVNALNNSTIYHTGNYTTSINYNLFKSDDTFADELLTITLKDSNGNSQERSVILNSNNKIDDFTFDEGLTYTIDVVYTAKANGENITSRSNTLIFVILKSTAEPVQPTLNIEIADVNYPNQVKVIVKSNVDGEYIVTIDGNNQDVTVIGGNGTAYFTLPINNYTAYVVSKNNASLKNSTTFKVLRIAVDDEEVLNITVPENSTSPTFSINLPEGNGTFTITVDGNKSISKNLVNGYASITLEELSQGNHSIVVEYSGDLKYGPMIKIVNLIINNIINNGSDVNAGTTIIADDLTRAYNSPYDFKATFMDKNGNPLNNTEVNFIINGNDNIVKTDEYGVAKIVNKLSAGSYTVEIRNLVTGEVLTKKVTIVSRITGNKDINVDYSYSASYKIRLFADNGQAVGAGENVLITLNNVKYNVLTDKNGYAVFKISNLLPKTYTITAEYKGVKVSNKVAVKQILKSKNVKVKKSKKVKKFSASLKTSSGKAIKGKKITFKIKGKTYSAKTNKKGVATIKIKKNLKVGKYKVKIQYLKTTITKTLKIKR